jgi:hypothetical protein
MNNRDQVIKKLLEPTDKMTISQLLALRDAFEMLINENTNDRAAVEELGYRVDAVQAEIELRRE